MRGSTFTGTLECWRGMGEDEAPVEVFLRLRVVPAPPEEGCGYEVDVLECTSSGAPFEATEAEIDRAMEQFTRGDA